TESRKQKAESRKQKTEKNCLIIHGSPDRDKRQDKDYVPENRKHWISWLKEKLEGNGYKVHNPQMPTPWQPDYEEWKKQVKDLDINENSIIVGYSAGGAFAVRWLSENKKKIDKLILVAAGKTVTEDNIRLHNFYDFKIDKEIKNRVNEIIIFVADNEKGYRIESSKLYQKELDGELRILKNRGHFTLGDNIINKKFLELLDEILEVECFTGEGININSDFPEEVLNNTKTSEKSSEEFVGPEDCYPQCEIRNCQSINSIYDNKKYVNPAPFKQLFYCIKDALLKRCGVKPKNGVEPAEGFEPSDHGLTIPDPHHATGTSTPSLLYQKNKNITKSLNGLTTKEAKEVIIKWLEEKGAGKRAVTYKLRDWCISRQRYWGPPIPMIECDKCGWIPVPEKDLPVELPEMDDFLPDGSGKGPLNKIKEFVNTTCPKCNGPAKRETDVSDPFVDSSWYFIRYPCTEFSD
ncbi:unnamed protein product, partial [marine sediment metagenome]